MSLSEEEIKQAREQSQQQQQPIAREIQEKIVKIATEIYIQQMGRVFLEEVSSEGDPLYLSDEGDSVNATLLENTEKSEELFNRLAEAVAIRSVDAATAFLRKVAGADVFRSDSYMGKARQAEQAAQVSSVSS